MNAATRLNTNKRRLKAEEDFDNEIPVEEILCTNHEDDEHYVNAATPFKINKRRPKAEENFDNEIPVEEVT